MAQSRGRTPDHNDHLGFPRRSGEAYSPNHSHADLDRHVERIADPAVDEVTSETTWGLVAKVGSLFRWARADHGHGTPPAPAVATCEIWLNSNQPIVEAVDTDVSFNTTIDANPDLRSSNGIVIQQAGRYHIWANVKWEASYSDGQYGGYRSLHLKVNGVEITDDHRRDPQTVHLISAMTNHSCRVKYLAVGDVVKASVLHQHTATGVNLLLEGGTGVSAMLGVALVST